MDVPRLAASSEAAVVPSVPPTTRTRPSVSNVADCFPTPDVAGPTALNVPVSGSQELGGSGGHQDTSVVECCLGLVEGVGLKR